MSFEYPPFASSLQLIDAQRNMPALKWGSSGDGVKLLQKGLVDVGYDLPASFESGGPDGVYKQETYRAVLAFQRDRSKESGDPKPLKADGIAGSGTITRLDFELAQLHPRDEDTAEAIEGLRNQPTEEYVWGQSVAQPASTNSGRSCPVPTPVQQHGIFYCWAACLESWMSLVGASDMAPFVGDVERPSWSQFQVVQKYGNLEDLETYGHLTLFSDKFYLMLNQLQLKHLRPVVCEKASLNDFDRALGARGHSYFSTQTILGHELHTQFSFTSGSRPRQVKC